VYSVVNELLSAFVMAGVRTKATNLNQNTGFFLASQLVVGTYCSRDALSANLVNVALRTLMCDTDRLVWSTATI